MIPLESLTWKMVGLYAVLVVSCVVIGVKIVLGLINLLANILLRGRADW